MYLGLKMNLEEGRWGKTCKKQKVSRAPVIRVLAAGGLGADPQRAKVPRSRVPGQPPEGLPSKHMHGPSQLTFLI